MPMVTDEHYEAVCTKIGDIPGWEIIEIWYDESEQETWILLSLAQQHWCNVIIGPHGACARGWLLDAEGPPIWVRGNEYDRAVWKAHAAFLWKQKRRPQ